MLLKLTIILGLTLLALTSIAFSLLKGSAGIIDPSTLHQIIFSIRLPRTVSAFVTGGLLALAGCMMQVLLRNPLADPYVLGVSGGAAVAAMIVMLFGLSGYWLIAGASFGSFIAILLALLLAANKKQLSSQHLLLTGIALASGFAAIISFILIMSPDKELHGMLFWLIGDLSFSRMPLVETIILLIGLIISFALARDLNILVRGEREAKSLGVNTRELQIKLFLMSSILTAVAVTLAGCIGFIGLIVPHLLRLMGHYDHRVLIPGCVLLGGSLLTVADTLSRTLFAPQQLPVGIMTALIGIPVFLILLKRTS